MWGAWKIKIPIILLRLHIICKSIQKKGMKSLQFFQVHNCLCKYLWYLQHGCLHHVVHEEAVLGPDILHLIQHSRGRHIVVLDELLCYCYLKKKIMMKQSHNVKLRSITYKSHKK